MELEKSKTLFTLEAHEFPLAESTVLRRDFIFLAPTHPATRISLGKEINFALATHRMAFEIVIVNEELLEIKGNKTLGLIRDGKDEGDSDPKCLLVLWPF